jgi:hypothetical protein
MFIDFPVRLRVAYFISSSIPRISFSIIAVVEVFTITLARGPYKVLPSGARWTKVF